MNTMSGNEWHWTPGVGVGPFKFDAPIADYFAEFKLKLTSPEGDDVTGWGTYEIKQMEDKIVWTEEGKIASVGCYDFFGYKGKNLIGMSEDEFIKHMGQQPDEIGTSVEYDNGSIQTPFEYEDLAMEAWSEDGVIVSASAYRIFED